MYLFGSCCLFHDCLTGCLSVLTVVSVCDRVEIWLGKVLYSEYVHVGRIPIVRRAFDVV